MCEASAAASAAAANPRVKERRLAFFRHGIAILAGRFLSVLWMVGTMDDG